MSKLPEKHLDGMNVWDVLSNNASTSPRYHASLLPATKLGQGYVFTGVCDSVHRGGVCLSACWDTTTPPGANIPLGADIPLEQIPPGSRHSPPPRSRHPPGSRPPWEQTPPPLRSRPPQEQTPAPRSRHPPPSRHTPPRADTPPAQSMLGDTVNARAVRILLECNLVKIKNCFAHRF